MLSEFLIRLIFRVTKVKQRSVAEVRYLSIACLLLPGVSRRTCSVRLFVAPEDS